MIIGMGRLHTLEDRIRKHHNFLDVGDFEATLKHSKVRKGDDSVESHASLCLTL